MINGSIRGGFKAFEAKIEKAADALEDARSRAVVAATLRIHELAVKMIQDVGDGTPTWRYNPKRVVNVSNPGDPPNSDTGRLVQSIKFEFGDEREWGAVGSNLKYAAWLEFGTETMEARPWLSAAVAEASKEVADIFKKEMDKAMQKIIPLGRK